MRMAVELARRLGDVAGAVPTALRFERGVDIVDWTVLPPAAQPFLLGGEVAGDESKRVIRSGVALLREAVAPHTAEHVTAGVIAQMSRCGSRLLARCAGEVGDVVVLSETPIVTTLLESRERSHPTLRSVLALYAQRFGVSRAVVKLPSIDIAYLGRFLRKTGHPRAVALFRDPVEVAVSNLLRPSFLFHRSNLRYLAPRIGGEAAALRRMNEHDSIAFILSAYLRMLLAASRREATAVVDYANLDAKIIVRLIEWLLGPVTPRERRRIAATSRIDAQRPWRRFRPDAKRKQREAPPALRAALSEATALYEQLKSRQRFP